MEVDPAKFVAEIKKFAIIGMDTSILFYHLEDVEPYSYLTEALFTLIAQGSPEAVLSTINVTELLVRPFSVERPERVEGVERFLFSLPHTTLVPVTHPIAKEAARIRAKFRVRTPDALLISTALHQKAEAFLTNDSQLKAITGENIAVIVLDDFLRG